MAKKPNKKTPTVNKKLMENLKKVSVDVTTDLKHIPLGTRLKDLVSGFEGIAIARVEYMNGCVQYYLKPKLDKDGKMLEAQSIDCNQLVVLDDGLNKPVEKEEKKEIPKGGIMPETPKVE